MARRSRKGNRKKRKGNVGSPAQAKGRVESSVPGVQFGVSPAYTVLNTYHGHLCKLDLPSTGDGKMYGDVNIRASKVQSLHKKDVIKVRMKSDFCIIDSEFADGKGKDPSYAHGMRLVWFPPVNIHVNAAGNDPVIDAGDIRGTFFDMFKTIIHFKNILKQPIRIICNSPRGRITDPSNPYVRRYKREFEIPAGRSRTFRMAWSDQVNIFTPMTVKVQTSDSGNKSPLPGFVIVDFQVVIPDTNIESGRSFRKRDADRSKNVSAYSDQTSMSVVEMVCTQHYGATAQYSGTVALEQRQCFAVLKNETAEGMLNEAKLDMDKISITPLCRQVSVDGRCMLVATSGGFAMPEGSIFTIDGLSGYFRKYKGQVVRWDMGLMMPYMGDSDVVEFVPAGACIRYLANNLEVSFTDVISFLTTLTEVVRVVALFF